VLFNINRSIYTYDNNGYKTGADILATYVSSDTVASSLFTLAYTITEGNVNSMRVNGYSYASFTYTTQVNKIDLVSFIGDYNGKINKNLRKSYHITAHSAPSTQPESSEYGYTINSEGLVIECEELFTPAYHVSTSDPAPERRITKYEYIFL
jgi:hypothetical protein